MVIGGGGGDIGGALCSADAGHGAANGALCSVLQ